MPLFKRTPVLQMPWGAAVGAGISLIGSQMSSKSNGGAGTTTTDKAPWAAAQPWILSNLQQGQNLQNYYTDHPLSAEQQQAVSNIYGQSDYMRGLVPSLLGQLGDQQVGFDPSNPTAKPKAWSWNGLLGGAPNLNQGSMQSPTATVATPDTSAKKPAGDFVNLDVTNPTNAYYGQLLSQNGVGADGGMWNADFLKSANGAGYGEFKYGQAMPQGGTQAYRDMKEYLAYGGNDPYNLYGGGPKAGGA